MDMTEKNGQPSMEEILASIRRIIAEEPGGTPRGIELKPKVISVHTEGSLEEHSDFELPSIFRASPAAPPEKHTPLLGRLTDAIRGAAATASDARAARTKDEVSAEQGESGASPEHGDPPGQQYPTLSSLKGARPEAQAAAFRQPGLEDQKPFPEPAQPAAPSGEVTASKLGWKLGRPGSPAPAAQDEVKRVMAPFVDTRFKQMAHSEQIPGTPSVPAAPAPLAQPGGSPQKVDFGAIIPAHMDLPGVPNFELQRRPDVGAAPVEPPPAMRADPYPLPPQPPPLALDAFAPMPPSHLTQGQFDPAPLRQAGNGVYEEHHAPLRPSAPPLPFAGPPTGTIEDATAELLRPMLRQWLADNMPRMVEKALHIEVAESVKPGKKPNIP